jgi:hypothetical protein
VEPATNFSIPTDIGTRVLAVRGEHVLLDADLAALHGVTTDVFNQVFRRKHKQFSPDFAFQLTDN